MGPKPMTRGSTPADEDPTTRATGFNPNLAAAASEATNIAQAPSFTPEALPAVTVPLARKGVGSLANASSVVSGRICSSSATVLIDPLGLGMLTGAISSAKKP